MQRLLPQSFSLSINSIGPIIGAIAAIIALIGGMLGIASSTSLGEQLSSAVGVVHKTQQPAADVNERNDLENEKQIPWSGYQQVDDNKVRVFFSARTPTCFGYRTDVVESAHSVRIKVYEGSLPNAPDVCTLDGTTSSIVVSLDSPLGARVLKN